MKKPTRPQLAQPRTVPPRIRPLSSQQLEAATGAGVEPNWATTNFSTTIPNF